MPLTRIAFAAAVISVAAAPLHGAPGPKPPIVKPHASPPHTPPAPTARAVSPAPTTHGNPHRTSATTSATTTAPHSPSPTTLNPIAQKISANRGLQPKMRTLLPPGMTLNQASLGFRNQGQFLAALHVSRNLGIPFADLKAAMTGPRSLSLGQAIHQLRPSANAETATTTAEHEATADLHVTVAATTTATTTTTAPKRKGR